MLMISRSSGSTSSTRTPAFVSSKRAWPRHSAPADPPSAGGALPAADRSRRKTTGRPITMQIGFVGLGRMGANMVRRLIRDQHQIVAYNRTPEKTKEIAGEGADAA